MGPGKNLRRNGHFSRLGLITVITLCPREGDVVPRQPKLFYISSSTTTSTVSTHSVCYHILSTRWLGFPFWWKWCFVLVQGTATWMTMFGWRWQRYRYQNYSPWSLLDIFYGYVILQLWWFWHSSLNLAAMQWATGWHAPREGRGEWSLMAQLLAILLRQGFPFYPFHLLRSICKCSVS